MPARYGSVPFLAQIAFFRAKVNLPSERWADVWRDGHDTGFMVAGAKQADLLADFRAAIDKGIAEGTTLAEFRKDFDGIVARHGWQYNGARGWRTRVIYETNLRTSYQAGRYAQMSDPALLRRRPYWRYQHSDAVTTPRALHLAWDGLVLRADDPWWQARFPPQGYGCKCRTFALSERDLRRLGKTGPDRAPDDGTYEWIDKVTGELHVIPNGVDPGWDYAPGASIAARVREQLTRKLARLPAALADALALILARPPAPPPPPPEPGPGSSGP